MPPSPSRNVGPSRADKLLTLDRGLLFGIFGIGVWVATNTAIRDDLVRKVEANEVSLTAQQVVIAQLQIDNAVLKTRLAQIDEKLAQIAASLERRFQTVP